MAALILVVENYADLRSAIADALSRGHYDCEEASSAGDAIGRLKDHHFSAILLSPSYPLESDPVIHFLAENQPDELQKVVLMTESDAASTYPTLVKPFGNTQLLEILRRP